MPFSEGIIAESSVNLSFFHPKVAISRSYPQFIRVRACILSVIPGDVVEAAVKKCEETQKKTVAGNQTTGLGDLPFRAEIPKI